MEYLEIDLNDIASEAIRKQITKLEGIIKENADKVISLRKEDKKLREFTKIGSDFKDLSDLYVEKFRAIDNVKNKNEIVKYKQELQFLFIQNILESFFGIHAKFGKWFGYRGGSLWGNLAVNYYDHKEVLFKVLRVLNLNPADDFFDASLMSKIGSFVMPYDYPKDRIMAFVKAPKYNTNGCIFDPSEYWVRNPMTENIPYSLLMRSPYILDKDVFSELLDTIRSRKSNWHYLYKLSIYSDLTKTQINAMGNIIISDITYYTVNGYDYVKQFVARHILDFSDKIVNALYKDISADNQFKTLNWKKFPVKYQQKYLMSRSFEGIMKILNNYDCKWTDEEKQSFLTKYLNK